MTSDIVDYIDRGLAKRRERYPEVHDSIHLSEEVWTIVSKRLRAAEAVCAAVASWQQKLETEGAAFSDGVEAAFKDWSAVRGGFADALEEETHRIARKLARETT